MVAHRTAPNGWRNAWRMTGSAFAILIARGTLCIGWLRRITYYITNCARERGVPGCTGADGWRMTGSAFASYRGAGRCN